MSEKKTTGVLSKGIWKDRVAITESEKKNMIAACACRIAEERGFDNFSSDVTPQKDWELATEEVNKFIAENAN